MSGAARRTHRPSPKKLYRQRRRLITATVLRNRWLPFWQSPNLIALGDIDRPVIEYREPSIRIEGVISPRYQHHQSGLHTLGVAAWKRPDGPVVEEKLHLIRPIPPGHGAADLPALSVQRLEVLLSEAWRRAVVRRVLPVGDPDPALTAVAERLAQPVIIESPQLGALVLDRQSEVFEGSAPWNGRPVAITLMDDLSLDHLLESIEEYLAQAHALWRDQAGWDRRTREFTQSQFQGEYDAWLEESEHTAQELAVAMELREIGFSGLDTVSFFYEDIFDSLGGHAISILVRVADGTMEIDLPG